MAARLWRTAFGGCSGAGPSAAADSAVATAAACVNTAAVAKGTGLLSCMAHAIMPKWEQQATPEAVPLLPLGPNQDTNKRRQAQNSQGSQQLCEREPSSSCGLLRARKRSCLDLTEVGAQENQDTDKTDLEAAQQLPSITQPCVQQHHLPTASHHVQLPTIPRKMVVDAAAAGASQHSNCQRPKVITFGTVADEAEAPSTHISAVAERQARPWRAASPWISVPPPCSPDGWPLFEDADEQDVFDDDCPLSAELQSFEADPSGCGQEDSQHSEESSPRSAVTAAAAAAAAVEMVAAGYPHPLSDHPNRCYLTELAQGNDSLSNLDLPVCTTWKVPAMAVALGASYLQRVLQMNPALSLTARRHGWFVSVGFDVFMCSNRGDDTLVILYLTCIYLACKACDRVQFKQQLSGMVNMLLGRQVLSSREAADYEAKILQCLGWRLFIWGPEAAKGLAKPCPL
ncbi:hypothetical protein N2152v2_002999 [Parachlorella kessleri]